MFRFSLWLCWLTSRQIAFTLCRRACCDVRSSGPDLDCCLAFPQSQGPNSFSLSPIVKIKMRPVAPPFILKKKPCSMSYSTSGVMVYVWGGISIWKGGINNSLFSGLLTGLCSRGKKYKTMFWCSVHKHVAHRSMGDGEHRTFLHIRHCQTSKRCSLYNEITWSHYEWVIANFFMNFEVQSSSSIFLFWLIWNSVNQSVVR